MMLDFVFIDPHLMPMLKTIRCSGQLAKSIRVVLHYPARFCIYRSSSHADAQNNPMLCSANPIYLGCTALPCSISRLTMGQYLWGPLNSFIASPSGKFIARMQSDGNYCVYSTYFSPAVW